MTVYSLLEPVNMRLNGPSKSRVSNEARRTSVLPRSQSVDQLTICRIQSGKVWAFCFGKSTQMVVAPPAA